MAKSSATALIPAPVEAVWETLADFGAISRWGVGVDESSLLTETSQCIGAARRVQVGRNTIRETITVWEPPHRLAYQLAGLPPIVRVAVNTWTLTSEGDSTRATLTSEVTGRPLLAHVVAGKLGKASRKLVAGLRDHHVGARA